MSEIFTPLQKVAFLGNYSPRQCGIATFTTDLRNAISDGYPNLHCPVIAVTDRAEGYVYPAEVRFEIPEQELGAYHRAADFLNLSAAEVLCVQHEYGIYGGSAGRHLLGLMRNVRMPIVTTLHTILQEPSPEQRRVLQEIIRHSARVVTMAQKGVDFLKDVYGADDHKIDLIPHGIPDVPFVDPNYFKDKFGVEGRLVILTFGLLSPNKGIENVINALPQIVQSHPQVVYIILGATHPNLVRDHGETYRLSLQRLARKNGVEKHVIFFNRFVSQAELTEFLGAADIYVTPYLNAAQITSGTLAYSFGTGKAVVSTPYWHAEELLAEGRGVVVPFNDAGAIGEAVNRLIDNEVERHSMRKQAYLLGRKMIWPEVAQAYLASFERARTEHSNAGRPIVPLTLDYREAELPPLKLNHLEMLTDDTGVFQHAVHTLPNYEHGYCTDDNARALILMILLSEIEEPNPGWERLTKIYAAFVQNAFNGKSHRFRNFMSYQRQWLEDVGSEDSHARAVWALGTCVGRSRNGGMRAWAAGLFEPALTKLEQFSSPRAWAFAVIGLHEYLRTLSGDRRANQLREKLAGRLLALFEQVADEKWFWCEDIVAYDNARIPHALILTGRWANQPRMLATGIKALRWLVDQQQENGYFRPVGSNGFWRRGESPAAFDQQPLEAHAMICACLEAHNATEEENWSREAQRIFDWFLGQNAVGLSLYDPTSGGCRDGLQVDRANQNEGAESTLAFLLSLVEMQRAAAQIRLIEDAA